MQIFLGYFLALVALWLGWRMIRDARRGVADLFSARNFFLLGFIVFQLTSASLTLFTGFYDAVQCADYGKTGLIYTFMAMTFLALFLTFYRKGGWATRMASKVRGRYGSIGPSTTLLIAVLFLAGAVLWRLVLTQIPVFGVLAVVVASGLAATAAGLAAWVWAPRWNNPVVGLLSLAIIGGSLTVVFFGDFGRRNALDIFLACLWGAHHGHWKHIGLKRASYQIIPVGTAAMVFLAAFTAGRGQLADSRLGVAESFARLGKGDMSKGFLDLATGQAAAACSMWLIDTRPDPFEYQPFHTLRYFIFHPIPRTLWEGKPVGLGSQMTIQASVRNRSKEFSFGPGLMGHIANDNPYLTMVPYAFGFAFMLRFMDQLVRNHRFNPFIIIPLGVALGDVVGLPRGEAGFFLFRITTMTVSAWVGIGFFGMIAKAMGVVMPPPDTAPVQAPVDDHDGSYVTGSDLIDPAQAAAYSESPDAEQAA